MPKLRVHPLFVCLLILLVMIGQLALFINMVIAVLIHELAHFRMARYKGYSIERMVLMPYGAILLGRENLKKSDAALIYLAGPVFNAVIALFIIAIWWLVPALYNITLTFVIANLILAIFNLIPLYPLDGSKIIINTSKNKLRTLSIMKTAGIIVSAVLFLLFIVSAFYTIHITLGVIAIFLFSGAVVGSDREKYRHMSLNVPFVKEDGARVKEDKVLIPSGMPLFRILKFIKPDERKTFLIVDKELNPIREIKEEELKEIFLNNEITARIGKVI